MFLRHQQGDGVVAYGEAVSACVFRPLFGLPGPFGGLDSLLPLGQALRAGKGLQVGVLESAVAAVVF